MASKKTKKKLKQASKSSGATKKKDVLNKDIASKEKVSDVVQKQKVSDAVQEQNDLDLNKKETLEKASFENKDAENIVKKDKQEQKASGKVEKVKVKKEKKPSRLKRKTKEIFSELKKVVWPTHSQVIKKTATVIAVVLVFSVVLLGIDSVLELAYNWFFGLFK